MHEQYPVFHSTLILRLKSELAALRLRAAARRLDRLLGDTKYNPDQPRLPAGNPGGGRWTSGDDEVSPRTTADEPWIRNTTTLSSSGEPEVQVIANRNATVTTTEWGERGVEDWAVRQTTRSDDLEIVTAVEFHRDGTGEIAFGPAAEGKFQLVNDDGRLQLASDGDQTGEPTGIAPEPGSRLALVAPGVAVATEAGAVAGAPLGAAAATIVVGATAFSSGLGGDTYQSLGPDLRLNQRDDGQAPHVEHRVDGRWVPVEGATAFAGGAGETIVVDAGRLRAAIGADGVDRAINALGERGSLTIVGERWTPENGRQMGVAPRDIEQSCRMYPDYKAAVEWAASAVDRNGLTPGQYGTAVHTAVDHYFKYNYPAFDPVTGQFDTEFSLRKDTGSAYYATRYGTAGSKRFDAYEDVGDGTVCGYDIKTGPSGLSRQRIVELRTAARGFYRAGNSGREPRQVIILEVRPWR